MFTGQRRIAKAGIPLFLVRRLLSHDFTERVRLGQQTFAIRRPISIAW